MDILARRLFTKILFAAFAVGGCGDDRAHYDQETGELVQQEGSL